jgi:SPP1 gp7 family putative phage head morphogenesis protein
MPRKRTSRSAERAKRRRAALAVMQALRPVEQRYVRDLRALVGKAQDEYMRRIVPLLDTVARKDAAGENLPSTIALLEIQVHAALSRAVGPLFNRMAVGAMKANAKGQGLLGVKVGTIRGAKGVITNTDIGIQRDIAAAMERNIALVENAHRVYAKSVRDVIADPRTFGMRVEEIKARLLERGDVWDSRAELIARDQTLKLNGQITATRQMRAGVNEYTWSTSQDDRVRESHAALEGQRFSWLAPPEVGHPGQDYSCRCVAIPVIEEAEGLF